MRQEENPEDLWLPMDSEKFIFRRIREQVLCHILTVRAFESAVRDGKFVSACHSGGSAGAEFTAGIDSHG
jgi:hypothetical protein